jgi:hypothetical protein
MGEVGILPQGGGGGGGNIQDIQQACRPCNNEREDWQVFLLKYDLDPPPTPSLASVSEHVPALQRGKRARAMKGGIHFRRNEFIQHSASRGEP